MEGNRTVTMTIRLTPQEKERIKYCARKLNMTQTEVLAKGIEVIVGMIEKHERNRREKAREENQICKEG